MKTNPAIKQKYRILIVISHPIQYVSPLLRRLANHPEMDILVAYCSLKGAKAGFDPGFGMTVQWDIPLLEGYPWVELKKSTPVSSSERLVTLPSLKLSKLIRTGGFDAVVTYTGYISVDFWILALTTKMLGVPLVFVTDAGQLTPSDNRQWKVPIKKIVLPRIFSLMDMIMVPSTKGLRFIRSLGVMEDRVHLVPHAVDNDWWQNQSSQVDRSSVRKSWSIPCSAPVVLFCGKLQPHKRPLDVIKAFANAHIADSYLIIAGDGPLRPELEKEVAILKLQERVRFLGFINQSELPSIYRASDFLVLPSEYEAFGLVVSEAMLCGCIAIVSDRVSAHHDLIQSGITGYVYPCGEIDELTLILENVLPKSEQLNHIRERALEQMKHWSPEVHVKEFVWATKYAINSGQGDDL